MEITLNEQELKILSTRTPKEKEVYLMGKFIHTFRLFNGGSQAECFRQINEFRENHGYKLWKAHGSLVRLWDKYFVSYEFPFHDENNY